MAIEGPLKLNVQLLGSDGTPAIGPGKALVLDAVAQAGSISAAGRALGMSYRRIWLLVDALNRDWPEPVVATRSGGGGGNAALTLFGTRLLTAYRRVEARMIAAAAGPDFDWLLGELAREAR